MRLMDDLSGKLVLARVVQFSYLEGSKASRRYSSSYVDTSKISYKTVGVYAHYYALKDEKISDLIPFEPLESIFITGYLTLENFVCVMNSSFFVDSEDNSVAFFVRSNEMASIIPNWRDCFCTRSYFNS